MSKTYALQVRLDADDLATLKVLRRKTGEATLSDTVRNAIRARSIMVDDAGPQQADYENIHDWLSAVSRAIKLVLHEGGG